MGENGNGNGRMWQLIVRVLMFVTPFMIGLLAYYVHAEGQARMIEVQAQVRAEYLSNADFYRWIEWRYKPDSKNIQDSLNRIEKTLEKHDNETPVD